MAIQLPPRQRGRSSCPGNGDTLGGDAARRRDERAARRAFRQAEAKRQARLRGKLAAALQAGKDVICVMGPGTFTRVGHFIALDGLDADGRAIVHDSNSYLRSHQSWDLDLIVSEMNCAWALSVA